MVLRSEILVNKNVLPTAEQALPGRETPMNLPETHFVNGNPLLGPFMDECRVCDFWPGLFLGRGTQVLAKRRRGQHRGGLCGRLHTQPDLRRSLLGPDRPHEVVLVVYDQAKVSYEAPAENVLGTAQPDPGHAPGQRHRHPVPLGDLRTTPEQLEALRRPVQRPIQAELTKAGLGTITTEIDEAPTVYFAEAYHQQYLAKNPRVIAGLAVQA
jgi:peptide-methionine (S)-S-oxide reductase